MSMTGRDHIAGQVGEHNRGTAIGSGISQSERYAQNYFDFSRMVRESLDNVPDEVMQDLTKFVYELYSKLMILEYEMTQLKRGSNLRTGLFVVAILLLLSIIWKLYFGSVEVVP